MRAMTRPRQTLLLLLACLTFACASERGDDPKQPAAGGDKQDEQDEPTEPPSTTAEPAPEPDQPVGEPPSFEGTRVRVSDGPLPFTLDLVNSGMSGDRAGEGDYLTLGGPPGGPLMLRIYPATVGGDVKKLIAGLRPQAQLQDGSVDLLGAERPAVTWITGESMARTLMCGVIVAPDGAAPGQPALLLELGVGHRGDSSDCKIARDHHVLGPVIDSLTFE
jgi:hypothetical protein